MKTARILFKQYLPIFLVVGFSVLGILFFMQKKQHEQVHSKSLMNIAIVEPGSEQVQYEFLAPKNMFREETRLNVVSSTFPTHTAYLQKAPEEIKIALNQPVESAEMQIFHNDKDFSSETVFLDNNKHVFSKKFNETSPDGLYTVVYAIQQQDGEYTRGSFQFILQREYCTGRLHIGL